MRRALIFITTITTMVTMGASCGQRVTDAERRQANNRARLAASMMLEGELASALREARQSVELDPTCIDCRLTLATVYAARDELPRAEEEYREVLRRDPGNPFAQNNLASVYMNMGRPTDAIPLAREASENEDYTGRHLAFYNLGWALLEQEEYAPALEALGRALREVPRMCVAHFRIAEVYFRQRQFEQAFSHLEHAIEEQEEPYESPTSEQPRHRNCSEMADAQHLLGLTLLALGNDEEAREAFQRCLEIATARSTLGRRCVEQLNAQE